MNRDLPAFWESGYRYIPPDERVRWPAALSIGYSESDRRGQYVNPAYARFRVRFGDLSAATMNKLRRLPAKNEQDVRR